MILISIFISYQLKHKNQYHTCTQLMDSLNSTIQSIQQRIILIQVTASDEVRRKICLLAVQLKEELEARTRMEMVAAFGMIHLSITEEEWATAEANLTQKKSEQRFQGEWRMLEQMERMEEVIDSERVDRLARQIFDQLSAALRGYREEENGEVKQAIEYAMDASNRIIEKIGKLKRRGKSNTEIKSLKRIQYASEEEKAAKPPLKFKKTQCPKDTSAKQARRKIQIRSLSQISLQRSDIIFDRAALISVRDRNRRPENTSLYTSQH